jgi:hypothetical protein
MIVPFRLLANDNLNEPLSGRYVLPTSPTEGYRNQRENTPHDQDAIGR